LFKNFNNLKIISIKTFQNIEFNKKKKKFKDRNGKIKNELK
jgi:hypothetical protein